MTDVFISYKSEDRSRVQPLVNALEADGIDIWWDAHIGGGDRWRESIEQNLAAAKCVIVAWSHHSTGPEGHFVRDEATRAQRHHAYLPVRIDAVEPPLGFGEVQALSLEGWKGKRDDTRYLAVRDAARAMIAGTGRPPASAFIAARPGIRRRAVLVGAGVGAAGVVGAGAWVLWPRDASAMDTSIAVMPFQNLSGDPGQAYFADGLSEELRSALTRIPEFKVTGRASSEAVRNDDARAACTKLGVASILTGSVRRSASKIRVSAQLVSGKDGFERWSRTYDEAAGDALEIQSAIAQAVAQALRIQLLPAERMALGEGGTRNAKAHDLLLQARALLVIPSPENAEQAKGMLDAAIALDPDYAEAYAWRARMTYMSIIAASSAGRDLTSLLASGKGDAERAITIAPKLAIAYRALGDILQVGLQFGAARAAFARGVMFGADPNALRGQAQFLSSLGEETAAKQAYDRAVALDPLNKTNDAIGAVLLCDARRYPEAFDALRRSLAKNPELGPNLISPLTTSQIMLARGKELAATLAPLAADDYTRLVTEAIWAARNGDPASANAAREQLYKQIGDAASYQYAEIYAQLGQRDKAFGALQTALRIRDPGLIALPTDPFVDPLRNDPEFKMIEAKLGLPG